MTSSHRSDAHELPDDSQLQPFADVGLTAELLETLIEEHDAIAVPRYRRLWSYYRNALAAPDASGGSLAPPAQCVGLPPRFHGGLHGALAPDTGHIGGGKSPNPPTREVVIENDIAWRIHTLCDFMFPKAPRLISRADTPARQRMIETILTAILDASGGAALWQDAALLGSVYGHVELIIDVSALDTGSLPIDTPISTPEHAERAAPAIAQAIAVDAVEAPRVIALLNAQDFRQVDALILRHEQLTNTVSSATPGAHSMLRRISRRLGFSSRQGRTHRRDVVSMLSIYSNQHQQRYINGMLVEDELNTLNRIPSVHIQNLSQPLYWEGLSDVEPLIPLQDELNTRISDRANRVTMQSFRMWLAKGITDFTDRPVGPGQMWATDNLDASIEGFGGDAASPSEAAHLEELREALDKASGVTPAAAGHIKARVGNLTSENALRISLMGTIAKTKRKRVTYGAGIRTLVALILDALDRRHIMPTDPAERDIDIRWADPLPPDESRRISDALSKAQLGIPLDVLRNELGYGESDGAEP